MDVRLVNEQEAANMLGLSPKTLRRMRDRGQEPNRMPVVPWIKMGKSVRYSTVDLADYIEKHRVAAEGL